MSLKAKEKIFSEFFFKKKDNFAFSLASSWSMNQLCRVNERIRSIITDIKPICSDDSNVLIERVPAGRGLVAQRSCRQASHSEG